MTDRSLDELGPVDYLIVEFPAGTQNFTGEGAAELARLHDAGIIRIMDILILVKEADGSVDAMELSDVAELGELARIETQLVTTLASEDVAAPRRGDESRQRRRRARLREPVGRAVRLRHASRGRPADRQRPDPHPGAHRRRRGRHGPRSRRSLTCRSVLAAPDEESSVGPVPVAKVAVVGAVASPGPSPVAKAAVVGAAVSPGPSPVAKAAVVGAVASPGRRRF